MRRLKNNEYDSCWFYENLYANKIYRANLYNTPVYDGPVDKFSLVKDYIVIPYNDAVWLKNNTDKHQLYAELNSEYNFYYTYFKTKYDKNTNPEICLENKRISVQSCLKSIHDYNSWSYTDSPNPMKIIAFTIKDVLDIIGDDITYEIISSPLSRELPDKEKKILLRITVKTETPRIYYYRENNDIELNQRSESDLLKLIYKALFSEFKRMYIKNKK